MIRSLRCANTYNIPEHFVQTKEPMVTLTYVGPRWLQSKQYLLQGRDTNSRRVFRFFSSCFLRANAIFCFFNNTNYVYLLRENGRGLGLLSTGNNATIPADWMLLSLMSTVTAINCTLNMLPTTKNIFPCVVE